MNLFDLIEPPPRKCDWVPDPPPCLDGITDLQINFETTGLKWWDGDHPIGMSVCYGDKTQYLPWGHKGGGNLDEAVCKRWFQEQVKHKRITNSNMRFDVHMGRVWGVDFEEQGNVVSDVQHYAALLDDQRLFFSLDRLATDFLGIVEIPRLDESKMEMYHAGEVAPRSEYNVKLVRQLRDKMWPLLTEQGLHKVRVLEDSLIYVVVEMEKNGTKIDVDLLDRWVIESGKEVDAIKMSIFKETGIPVNPASTEDLTKLFSYLKLPLSYTRKGAASFTSDILKLIDHPTIKKVFRARKVSSLRSKYLVPYARTVDRRTGILRYALHQLRARKDEFDQSGRAGTISGRFSSTKLASKGHGVDEDEGLNIQQIYKPAKQRVVFGFDEDDDSHDDELYVIRQLHIPEEGLFLSADAMQIEYRIFAAETNAPRLLDIYKQDPLASFHKKVHAMLKDYVPSLTYRRCKDTNFAYLYGAGVRKMGYMLGYCTEEEYVELLSDSTWWNSPLLKEVFEIRRIYEREVPEAKALIDRSSQLAKERGYIKSILGRRIRFHNGERAHKGLNSRIQMSAAEIMKAKLIELHRDRKKTGFKLRFTVHDECDGDATGGKETAQLVDEILNRQSFNLRVPIRWETSVGKNWKQMDDWSIYKEDEFAGAHASEPNRGSLLIPGEHPDITYQRTHPN